MERIRERAGPELNVLFVESVCKDPTLLESNMRLKLSGPDYEGKDPVAALEDFKQRVAMYEKNYIPLGDYEEDNNMPYVSMIDVGRTYPHGTQACWSRSTTQVAFCKALPTGFGPLYSTLLKSL
jgi:hypothetical protein